MTNVKSLLALYVKMGGSLTDTYADIAGGVPVGQYSTISDAILACSKKYSSGGGGSYTLPTASADTKGGVKIGSGLTMTGEVLSATGGGAEKFVVTLTRDAQTDEWTADKTVAEIVAAYEAGKIVECEYPFDTYSSVIPVNTIISEGGENAVVFTGLAFAIDGTRIVNAIFEGNSVVVYEVPIPTSTNAPLIVTMTADQSTGNFVGDKTNEEVYSAFTAGKAVILSASIGSSALKLAVQYATFDGTDYEFAFIDSSAVKNTVSGGANDYVTASLT